jgi:hypothetical protein
MESEKARRLGFGVDAEGRLPRLPAEYVAWKREKAQRKSDTRALAGRREKGK